jgi:hypothetical protein
VRAIGVPLLAALVLAGGCAHGARRTGASSATGSSWLEAPLVGERIDVAVLEPLAAGSCSARIVRLDYLIDLLDAARFAEDEHAREALWIALGGHALGIGFEATREATGRLLQEALAIETDAERDEHGLDESHRRFLADAIMMLTVDLEHPATAEGLSIRTLAYRSIVDQGHDRIADNARWRLYDHVRGTLEGAADAPPRERMEVAVQALYAERDRVDAWLEDTAPHARPPWPTPSALWSTLEQQRDALAALSPWAAVMATREHADLALRETVMMVLPAPREPSWAMPLLPGGTGQGESLAPVVLASEGALILDAGRPGALELALPGDPAKLPEHLRTVLVQDGRGIVLLAGAPGLPSPELHAVLQGLAQAQTSRIELAIREPRLGTGDEAIEEETVVLVLPLEVAQRTSEPRGGTLALLEARVAVHLTGRGPRFAIDGRALPGEITTSRELEALVRTIARAYPRERIVRLTLEADVMLDQLVELLAALEGGPDRPFSSVGWHPESTPPPPPAESHARILHARAEAWWPTPKVALSQPYPFAAEDQKRLEAFTATLSRCIPELEHKTSSVAFALVFSEGRLIETRTPGLRAPAPRADALRSCVDDLALSFRLRQHRDRVEIGVALSPG